MLADSDISFYSTVNDEEDNSLRISFKRPKLLNHQFNLVRQNILLLSTKGLSTSAILAAQESKIKQFTSFLDSLESAFDSWNGESSIVVDGLEMLLRAVHAIKSTSKHNLLLKMHKFKLKILLKHEHLDISLIEECFNECTKNSNNLDSFEQYYGIHPQLDSLIGAKILDISYRLNIKEKIKMCWDLQKQGNRDNILKDLMIDLMHTVKTNPSILSFDVMINLMKFMGFVYKGDVNSYAENLMIIYQSNRQEFLENSSVFDKFLESSRFAGVKDSLTVITMFNSRIRSYLSRPEAKKDSVIQNCTKFVLEYYELGIGCIGQFADFLLKCPILKLADCSASTRRLIYKLLRIYLKTNSTKLSDSKFLDFVMESEDLQYEFVRDMLEQSGSTPDFILLTIYLDYLDEKYIGLLEMYLKKYTGNLFATEDEEDFLMCFSDYEDNNEVADEDCGEIKEEFVEFLKENLLSIYVKKFKTMIQSEEIDMKFIKIVAIITGLLMNSGKVKWAELSGTFGPNAALNTNTIGSRSIYCTLFSLWMKMEHGNLISGSMRITLRGVLNPQNCPELWTKALLDFRDYGQVGFFNEYYNLFLNDRIECFKLLNIPGKFVMESIFKCVDFRSSISNTWWSFLVNLAAFIIKMSPELSGPICAKYEKYFPHEDFGLIIKFYEIAPSNKRTLLLKHVTTNDDNNARIIINALKANTLNSTVLAALIYEFLNCEYQKEVFLIQLACVSIIKLQPEAVKLNYTAELRRISFIGCNWSEIYRKLYVLTELLILPDNFNELLRFLSEVCNMERFLFKEFDIKYGQSEIELDPKLLDFNFTKKYTILSSEITAFTCLTQLLYLITRVIDDYELDEYVEYVRKKKGHSDEYFNVKFVK